MFDEEKIEQRKLIFQNWLNNKCRYLMVENELDYHERTHFENLFLKFHPIEVIQYYQDTGIMWPKNSFNDDRFESLMKERDRCWELYHFYDDLFYDRPEKPIEQESLLDQMKVLIEAMQKLTQKYKKAWDNTWMVPQDRILNSRDLIGLQTRIY